MLLALYFFVVIALPLALGIYVALNGVQRSRICPTCAEDTLLVRSRLHGLLSTLTRKHDVQRRWCLTCGWQGSARVPKPPAPARRDRRPRPASPSARESARDRVDIRRLEIDGSPWQVMVQCWAEEGRWVGRFLFVGPDGRACMEEGFSLEGGSAIEVLSSALSVPEKTLAGRLRRAIH
jgi:hypothetical protein